jgi:putative intracellular protease/amidase
MRNTFLGATAGVVVLGAVLGPLASAPTAQAAAQPLSIPAPKEGHVRPMVAIIAGAGGAEVTDFIVPFGVLKESGVFDVRTVATRPGPTPLFRALKIQPDQTLEAFDAQVPEGADIVIVPAQLDPTEPALQAWIKTQAAKGATIVSICEGARAVAAAGLLSGKRATTHWKALPALEKAYPSARWVRDRRYLQDGAIVSTTGVSASIPVSLALVEAVGGRAVATATASRIGVSDWSPVHRTARFHLSKLDYARALGAYAARWTHETVEVPVVDGEDEISLALRADAWTRSYRTRVVTTSHSAGAIRSAHGMTILVEDKPRPGRFVLPRRHVPAAAQLDAALADMGQRYGPFAVRLARLSMEYDGPGRGG